ncbi:MAG: hypothetical protein D6772_07335, partial [Bacteroidetes bacterium]
MTKTHLLLTSLFFLTYWVQAQPLLMSNDSIAICGGIFTDSGYQNPYGENEEFTLTICSDAGGNSAASHIRLDFFDFDLGPGDTLYLYDGDSVDAPPFDLGFLASASGSFSIQATAANPTGCVTAVFRSDGVPTANAGWLADVSCT